MRGLYRLSIVSAIVLAIGCRDDGLTRLEEIRDEVCRCKTPTCGEQAMEKVGQTPVESTQRSQRIARAMMDCLARLYEQDRPDTGPDTDTEPTEPAGDGPAAATP